MSDVVGEEFEDYVKNQIIQRQKVHSSGVNNLRTGDQISYLNSKTSWVKFASAVSVTQEKLTNIGIDNSNLVGMGLAKNNILFGGTSTLVGENLKPKSSNVGLSGYQHSDEWGIVPMPGIESVDIKTLTRGSIEKATIKLKAYSRKQFDIIDILYLRLGYTVLLEWGVSNYIANDGTYKTINNTLVEDPKRFFSSNFSSGGSFLDILPQIEEKRKTYNGNYDGLLGKISNFNWSFNPDGSYDITVTVVSLGDVIESLKTNLTPSIKLSKFINSSIRNIQSTLENTENSEAGVRVLTESPTSDDISAMLWVWKYINKDRVANKEGEDGVSIIINSTNKSDSEFPPFKNYIGNFLYNSIGDETIGETITETKEEFVRLTKDGFPITRTVTITRKINQLSSADNPIEKMPGKNLCFYIRGKEKNYYYLKFGALLQYIQEVVLPSIKSKRTDPPIFSLSYDEKENQMYFLPNQISLDPRVCLVRNKKFQKRSTSFSKVLPELSVFKSSSNSANIMNIYLNFDFITNSLDSNKDVDGNVNVYGFISSLCDGLNEALGGINNLEPVVDKITNKLKIIDSTPIPGVVSEVKNPPYTLEMYGYNPDSKKGSNFVRDIKLKTAITPEYATMVTVGATAGGYVKGVEATAFSNWNRGLTDRFNSELINNVSSGIKNEAEVNYAKKFLKELSLCYGFSGIKIKGEKKYIKLDLKLNEEAIDSNIGVVTEFYRFLQADQKVGNSIGFIPFKLGLTLDGISGIKIYNKLHIDSRFLPSNYGKELDLLVTGISHKLSNDDWTTEIETTTIPKAKYLKKLNIDFSLVGKNIDSNIDLATNVTSLNSPSPNIKPYNGTVSPSQEKKIVIFIDAMVQVGYTYIEGAGIAGNVMAESGFQEGEMENGKENRYNASQDAKNSGVGLMQWTDTRGVANTRRNYEKIVGPYLKANYPDIPAGYFYPNSTRFNTIPLNQPLWKNGKEMETKLIALGDALFKAELEVSKSHVIEGKRNVKINMDRSKSSGVLKGNSAKLARKGTLVHKTSSNLYKTNGNSLTLAAATECFYVDGEIPGTVLKVRKSSASATDRKNYKEKLSGRVSRSQKCLDIYKAAKNIS